MPTVDFDIEPLLNELKVHNVATSTFRDKVFFICKTEHLNIDTPGLCIGLEQGGFLVWTHPREATKFDLLGAGFNLDVAEVMALVLNALRKLQSEQTQTLRKVVDHE